MLDFLILIACTYLIIIMANNKSAVKRICSLILLVFFATVLFFSTEDPTISSLASKLIGKESHSILKDALTNINSMSFAGNSVWLFYKLYLIISVLFYGCALIIKTIKKIFVIAIFKFKDFVSKTKSHKVVQSKQSYYSKIFLINEKLIN